MDAIRFDALTRALGHVSSRRASIPLLGGLLAFLPPGNGPTYAKKKKKKTKLCFEGQTIQASKKKKKKLLKSGATPGECPPPPSSPPPPPPGCTPNCPGAACGGDDGCAGICSCAANSICHEGACHPYTVPCTGSSVDCGGALQARLIDGGTIYLGPGRYTGAYALGATTTLIGAGKGDDPAVDTILDANKTGRVLNVAPGVTATLSGVRITGGNESGDGGGIHNQGQMTIDNCAIVGNIASHFGGGVFHAPTATGPLTISNSTVADNLAQSGGGFYLNNDAVVTISACVISGNRSILLNRAGGGIYNLDTPLNIMGSQLTENFAADIGGGIYNNDGTVTFDSASSVTDNTAVRGSGGIYNDFGGAVFLNSATVSGNSLPQCFGVGGAC